MSDFRVQPEDVALWFRKRSSHSTPYDVIVDRINTWAKYDADYHAIVGAIGSTMAKVVRATAYYHQTHLPAHLRPDSWGTRPRGAKKAKADAAKQATKPTVKVVQAVVEVDLPIPTAQEIVQAYHNHVTHLEARANDLEQENAALREENERLQGTNESVQALRKVVGR